MLILLFFGASVLFHIYFVHKWKHVNINFNNRLENEETTTGSSYTDEEISALVDIAFTSMDKNNDGFVDFPEYRREH